MTRFLFALFALASCNDSSSSSPPTAPSAPSAADPWAQPESSGEPPPPPADSEAWKAACGDDWAVRAGPAVSATDPHPTDYYRPGERVPPSTYVTFELKRKGDASFPHCIITSSAYHVMPDGTRRVLTQRDRELQAKDSVLYKSWIFRSTGQFLVEFREASTRRPLATYALTVEAK